jgi:two-component system nitrate/nitrite response regulator NarL
MSHSFSINILMVMGRLLFREALAALLAAEPDFKIAAHVPVVQDALRVCFTTKISCVIVEYESRQLDLSGFLNDLRLLAPTPVLLLGDMLKLQQLEELRHVVAGILPNSSNAGELIDAVRRLSAGHSWRDLPALDGSGAVPHHRRSPILTSRQQMVLHLVCDGLSNKECAATLGVSPSSIKCTIQQLFVKTRATSRSQLVRRAMEEFWEVVGRPLYAVPAQAPRQPRSNWLLAEAPHSGIHPS